ncbi:peroxide stress protein YaaA [Bacteroidota bacterium]
MITIIGPAKRVNFENTIETENYYVPFFLDEAEILMNKLKKFSKNKLKNLLDISDELAELNTARHTNWKREHNKGNAKEAIFAFQGDVYNKLEATKFSKNELEFANEHVLIISGLYGILRPLDLIQPYRLEMGSKFSGRWGNNLYEFWREKLTQHINQRLEETKSEYLINLASKEYYKVLNNKEIKAKIITPVFKDFKNGNYKVLFLFAKFARGLMTKYIVENKIIRASELKLFQSDGYQFSEYMSGENEWIFIR